MAGDSSRTLEDLPFFAALASRIRMIFSLVPEDCKPPARLPSFERRSDISSSEIDGGCGGSWESRVVGIIGLMTMVDNSLFVYSLRCSDWIDCTVREFGSLKLKTESSVVVACDG